jgi:chemotaxis response regulator CheB
MANKNIIVIGASYEGIEAMKELVAGLPERFPATILLVQHVSPAAPGMLPQILTNAGPLPASFPADFESLKSGHIYVAPGNPWEELQKIISPRPDRSKGGRLPARLSRVELTIN